MPNIEAKPVPIAVKTGFFNPEVLWGRKGDKLEPSRRMTQKQLAEAAGVSAYRVCLFETLRAYPTPEEAQRIADVLGKDSEILFPYALQFFITSKDQPAQVRVRLTEREVGRVMLQSAQDNIQDSSLFNIKDLDGSKDLQKPNLDYVVGFASILDKPEILINDAREALQTGDPDRALKLLEIAENRVVFPYNNRNYRDELYQAATDPNSTLDNIKVRELRLVNQVRNEALSLQKHLEDSGKPKVLQRQRASRATVHSDPNRVNITP